MSYVLAIDLGSSQMKLLAMNQELKVSEVVTRRYVTTAGPGGRLTQNPADWRLALSDGMRELGERISLTAVDAVSFSGHMSGLVAIGRDEEVLAPCIMLADTRSGEECKWLRERVGEPIRRLTGNPVLQAFTLPKLLWIKQKSADCYENMLCWVSPKDYIRYLFTGIWATEYTDAFNSLCIDPISRDWSEEIIALTGINRKLFPPVFGPMDVAGHVTKHAAEAYGLKAGVPVVYGGADMACGAVGNGLFEAGDSTLTLGTCATFLSMMEGGFGQNEFGNGKVTFHMHLLPDRMYALGSHFNGGLAVDFFTGLFDQAKDGNYEMAERLSLEAWEIPPGSGGILTIPFLVGSGSPWYDVKDRLHVLGVTASATKGQLFRSLLEGISFNLKQSLELFEAVNKKKMEAVVLGGGGIRVKAWPRIITDIFGRPMRLAENADASAVGAALAGGLGVGMLRDLKEASSRAFTVSQELIPSQESVEIYEKHYQKYLNTCRVLDRLKDQER